jgi:hypothetical protein
MPKNKFLQALTDLANEHGVVCFAVSAVLPSEEGFAIVGGCASRLDDTQPESAQVVESMRGAVESAIEKLKSGTIETTYLN